MALRMKKSDVKILQYRLDGDEPEDVTPKKRDNEEEREQILFFERRAQFQGKYANLEWMYSTLNGVFVHPSLKKKLVASGLTKGVLDIWYHGERRDPDGADYIGCVMDMKKKKNGRPSPEQLAWAKRLIALGYRVYFPEGAVDAWRILCSYLGISGADHLADDMARTSEYMSTLAAAMKAGA